MFAHICRVHIFKNSLIRLSAVSVSLINVDVPVDFSTVKYDAKSTGLSSVYISLLRAFICIRPT